MGRRKVGDTPFDLHAYFEVIDSFITPGRVHEENAIFTNVFMPTLRAWSAHCMDKIELKRESLAKVVGDACHQSWKKISKKQIQFSDIKARGRGQPVLSNAQHQRILIGFHMPEELIHWLDEENQVPQPHPPPAKNPPNEKRKADLLEYCHVPQRLDPVAEQRITPAEKYPAAEPEKHPSRSDSTVDFQIGQMPLASDVGSSDDDPDQDFEPVSAGSWDYWAEPDAKRPGNSIEAPKIPRCGPWEIPLPANMDTSMFVEPYVEQINALLGVLVECKSRPPAVIIRLTKKQQAHITANPRDKTYGQLVNSWRWKAFNALFAWARHLHDHASKEVARPLGVVEFISKYLIEEGDTARESSISKVRNLKNRPVFNARECQLPETHTMKRKLADATSLSDAPEPRSRQRSSTYDLEPTRGAVFTIDLPGPIPQPKVDAGDNRNQPLMAAGSRNNTMAPANDHPSTNRPRRKQVGPFLPDEEDENEVKIEDE